MPNLLLFVFTFSVVYCWEWKVFGKHSLGSKSIYIIYQIIYHIIYYILVFVVVYCCKDFGKHSLGSKSQANSVPWSSFPQLLGADTEIQRYKDTKNSNTKRNIKIKKKNKQIGIYKSTQQQTIENYVPNWYGVYFYFKVNRRCTWIRMSVSEG